MKLALELACESSTDWLDAVMNDFDAFLQDHADCERKASAMAMSMVAKYPDRPLIIPELIETAIEELEHFEEVYTFMQQRGVKLRHEIPADEYVKALLKKMNSGLENQFLDRLLLGSVIECRGAERFRMIYEALEEGELKDFYHRLWASEAKHGDLFVKLSLHYFDEKRVYSRLEELISEEAKTLKALPVNAALH